MGGSYICWRIVLYFVHHLRRGSDQPRKYHLRLRVYSVENLNKDVPLTCDPPEEISSQITAQISCLLVSLILTVFIAYLHPFGPSLLSKYVQATAMSSHQNQYDH